MCQQLYSAHHKSQSDKSQEEKFFAFKYPLAGNANIGVESSKSLDKKNSPEKNPRAVNDNLVSIPECLPGRRKRYSTKGE